MSSIRVVKVQVDINGPSDFVSELETLLNVALGAGPYLVTYVEKRDSKAGKETYYVWVVDNPLT